MKSDQTTAKEIPVGDAKGFRRHLKADLLSGFLVFLIALPLCLGIALASGFPAIAGVFTAIIGALVTTFISNSELTIKGPAAGLIVIIFGAVESFGGDGMLGGFGGADYSAYRMVLAVIAVSAVLQILFGLKKGGILGEFFPLAAVHGMLAAIGVIIMVKHIPIVLGVSGKGEPLEMVKEIPHYIQNLNPRIALIGIVGTLIMFLWPTAQRRSRFCKLIPSPVVVLLVTVPLGIFFNLTHEHSYQFAGVEYSVSERYLVNMPDHAFGMFHEITTPDFGAFSGDYLPAAIKWTLMFFIIGSLESVLSAKAVDVIDPWKRKSNMDRDIVAVGAGNLACAFVGGLPMISEIVRSKANIDNGARTRFANLWHGVFLLVFVALIPTLIHRIPLAALASMLLFTGFRLAHPNEFRHALERGREQLAIFVVTLVGVLMTDLLVGIMIGIALKIGIHLFNGASIKAMFSTKIDFDHDHENHSQVKIHRCAVFTNWIPLRGKLIAEGLEKKRNLTLDLSDCDLIDHSVMEKLGELKSDFEREGLAFELTGLDAHHKFSPHPLAGRRRAR